MKLNVYKILAAVSYETGGVRVKLTPTEKLVMILLDYFFTKGCQENPLEITQQYIANCVGQQIKSVNKSLNSLIANGLLGAEKYRSDSSNFEAYRYYSFGGKILYTAEDKEIHLELKVRGDSESLKDLTKEYSKPYYVYVCYVNDEIVYVGKGKGKRLEHCKSGRSSNALLNQALFEHGEESVRVEKIHTNLTDSEALILERMTIEDLKARGVDLYNSN